MNLSRHHSNTPQQGQTYTNKSGGQYTVLEVWWKGFYPSSVVIIGRKSKKEYLYSIEEFESAVRDGELVRV